MVEPSHVWTAAVVALGLPAGFLVARASTGMAGAPSPNLKRYALAMTACLAAGAWAAVLAPAPSLAIAGTLLGWLLVLLAMLDAEHFWLPHRLTVPLGLMGLAQAAAFEPDQFLHRLIGASVGFAVLAGVAFAYRRLRGREGLGGGDARLLAAAGAWVGWVGLPSVLLIAAVSGLAAVAGTRLIGRKPQWTDRVPFGVFLAVGLWLTWLYGPIGQ